MSLLMDALKQAEQAKEDNAPDADDRVRGADESAAADGASPSDLSLELPDPEPIEETIEREEDQTRDEDCWIGEQPAPVTGDASHSGNSVPAPAASAPESGVAPPAEAAPQGPAAESRDRAAEEMAPQNTVAQQTGESSMPGAAAHVLSASRAYERRRRAYLLVVFTGLFAGVGVALAVYWHWAQSLSQPQFDAPVAWPVPADTLSGEMIPTTTSPAAETNDAEDPAAVSDATGQQNWQPAPVDPQVLQTRVDSHDTKPVVPDPEKETLRILRSGDKPGVQSALSAAYSAYDNNQLSRAQKLYREVLTKDPRNRDALLGLAAVAVKNHDLDLAAGYYHRLLELYPRDSAASAGITMLAGGHDPVAAESRIKLLLKSQPDAAYLYFALGNVYSDQERWPEAQDAYFNSVRIDKDNPDYVYNLAISLDRISKHNAALRYYRTALALSSTQSATFSPQAVRERIRVLDSAAVPVTPDKP